MGVHNIIFPYEKKLDMILVLSQNLTNVLPLLGFGSNNLICYGCISFNVFNYVCTVIKYEINI